MLHGPALLVMDEATNAIQDDLQGRILGRLRARGTGCLIVSHRETVIQAADCVHVIMNGAVAYSGPPRGLAARADLNAVLREADAA
jgi:ABC-type bacteriocin/lantibiotic exporter with double-glycine peptidase domain